MDSFDEHSEDLFPNAAQEDGFEGQDGAKSTDSNTTDRASEIPVMLATALKLHFSERYRSVNTRGKVQRILCLCIPRTLPVAVRT